MDWRLAVVGVAGSYPKMPQHTHWRRPGGHARQYAMRRQADERRHDNAVWRLGPTDAVHSCFETAVELIDDGVTRGVQPRMHSMTSRREAMAQVNRHYHGQAEGKQ